MKNKKHIWNTSQKKILKSLNLDYLIFQNHIDKQYIKKIKINYNILEELHNYDIILATQNITIDSDIYYLLNNIKYFLSLYEFTICIVKQVNETSKNFFTINKIVKKINPKWIICFGKKIYEDFLEKIDKKFLIKTLELKELLIDPLKKKQVFWDVRHITIQKIYNRRFIKNNEN